MDFEKLALKALLDGKVSIIPNLTLDYFTKNNVKIYEKILEFFKDNKRTPTYSEISAIISAKAPANVSPQYLAIIKSIQDIQGDTDIELISNGLQEAFTIREVDKEMQDLVEASRTKDTSEVKRLINLLAERINTNGVTVRNMSDMKDHEENQVIVRSFLDKDTEAEYLGGGHTGVTIYSADSGGGKSIALGKTAINNHKDGKNVLFITLELSAKVMYNRLISSESQVDFTRINEGKLTPEEKKAVKDAHESLFKGDNKFLIVDDTITDSELLNLIAVEVQVNKIDVVVIDYLQLVEPDGYSDEWKAMTKLCKNLHKLTKKHNIAIISASQVNSEGKEKGSIVPKISTRGTKEVKFSSSQFIHFEMDQSGEVLYMFQMKNRIAKPRHLILQPMFQYMDIVNTGVELEV